MSYSPPTNYLEVLQNISFDDELPVDDPRYVDTRQARGSERMLTQLARKFGYDFKSQLFFAPQAKHVLFFGHIGSGKTTELIQYKCEFDKSRRFYVVKVDVLAVLDRNNLQYTEALMAMAQALFEQLHADGCQLPDSALEPLKQWFVSVTQVNEVSTQLSAEISTGIKGRLTLPLLANLTSRFTSAFKTNASSKEERRTVIRNHFSQLAEAFAAFIQSAEQVLKERGRADRVLFLLDGTDKMSSADTAKFFIDDVEQLLAINTLAIYAAPINLKYDGRLQSGKLDADLVLPMIKLHSREGERFEAGWDVLRKILLQRADRSLFAQDPDIDALIEHSGGHPRELLRLLKLCCEIVDDKIDSKVVAQAIEKLAADFRYWVTPEDYQRLARIDSEPEQPGNDALNQRLLHRLALLQYNGGSWQKSHPVVRTLEGYKLARSQLASPAP